MLPFLPALIGLVGKATDLGSKFVLDKDKQAEYAFKQQEMTFRLVENAMNQPTYKWVNAVVKLLWAFQPLWRPLGSLVLAGVAVWCKINGYELGGYTEEIMMALPVAWGLSREAEKRRKR